MIHILVVEDNSALARVICFNLEAAGFKVTTAYDGQEALECAQHHQFDLVITDYGMPRMTGADLCRRLRELSSYLETPIVMITTFGRDLDLVRLREELHLATIIPKPFSPNDLVAVAKKLAGLEQTGQDLTDQDRTGQLF